MVGAGAAACGSATPSRAAAPGTCAFPRAGSVLTDGAYILNYTTNENIVPILEAVRPQNKTEFLQQPHLGILFSSQQPTVLLSA